MTRALLLTIVASVTLSATSQVLLKAGMVSPLVRQAMAAGDPLSIVAAVARSPSIVAGFLCFGVVEQSISRGRIMNRSATSWPRLAPSRSSGTNDH